MTLRVRALSEEEGHRLARMTRSQKLGAGLVRRAQIIQHAVDGLSAPGIAAKMGLCGATVRFWLKRFNERGLSGLAEEMRSGRPPTYTAEERSAVIAAALSRPAELGLPFASWTLDRLVAYLGKKGIGMKRSRVSEVLLAEGLKWRQEETWFGARVDPEFERKRGRSSASTPPRPRAGWSSASTRWDRNPRQELPRPARGQAGPSPSAAGQAGDRLRPTGQRLCLWCLPAGHGGGLHRNLPGPHHCELGRFPRRGRALDRCRGRTGLRGGGQSQRPQRH